MNSIIKNATAGLVATIPMTIFLLRLHKELPKTERYPLPPREITDEALDKLGIEEEIPEPEKVGLTYLAHFSYGALVGGLYTPIEKRLPIPPILKGSAYGLSVWSVSYLGLLPALHLLKPATRHPRRRPALMILAHLVWGVSLGLLASSREGDNSSF